MDVIQAYINLYVTGFEVGIGLSVLPVIMGSAIGAIYKIIDRG